MPTSLPHVRHTYQNWVLDSTVWRRFVPRADDIVIATSYKSGTTWTQAILAHLILGTQAVPNLDDVSPWIDHRLNAAGDVIERLDAQQHRRFIKSHLALDGLPYFPHVKYIVVGRDARDVFMSLWNHHSRYQEALVAKLNAAEGRHGPPLPWPPQDIQPSGRTGSARAGLRGNATAIPIGAICTTPRRGGSTATWRIFCLCISTTCWPTYAPRSAASRTFSTYGVQRKR